MVKWALIYAEDGWFVFPVHTSQNGRCSCEQPICSSVAKHPRTSQGLKEATRDPEQIRKWWQQWPDSNIAIHMGRSDLVVLDIDTYHGGQVSDLPLHPHDLRTVTAETGGGGTHLFYRAPIGFQITNSGKWLPKGIDVRASEGYVLVPPSLHVSGRHYRWLQAPGETRLLSLPASLLPLLVIKEDVKKSSPVSRPPQFQARPDGDRHPYVAAALKAELDKLAQAKEGHRNNTLNQAGFSLGQFVGAGLLSRDEVETLLTAVARAVGLGETEIQKTLASAINAGINNPRHNWPDLT